MGKLWGPNQHFPHILPTFCQLTSHPHKSSTNYQLQINISPTNPFNQRSIFFLPTQKSMFCLQSHILSMHRFLVWGDCGDYVDMGKMFIPILSLFSSKQLFHCGENVGKMLTLAKHGVNVDACLFLTLLPNYSSSMGRMW